MTCCSNCVVRRLKSIACGCCVVAVHVFEGNAKGTPVVGRVSARFAVSVITVNKVACTLCMKIPPILPANVLTVVVYRHVYTQTYVCILYNVFNVLNRGTTGAL